MAKKNWFAEECSSNSCGECCLRQSNLAMRNILVCGWCGLQKISGFSGKPCSTLQGKPPPQKMSHDRRVGGHEVWARVARQTSIWYRLMARSLPQTITYMIYGI
jgi:hypothetical protein